MVKLQKFTVIGQKISRINFRMVISNSNIIRPYTKILLSNARCVIFIHKDNNEHRSVCQGFNALIINVLQRHRQILFDLFHNQRQHDFTPRQLHRFISRIQIFDRDI